MFGGQLSMSGYGTPPNRLNAIKKLMARKVFLITCRFVPSNPKTNK